MLLEAVIRERPRLASPDGAASQCAIVADELIERLGPTASRVWVRGHREEPAAQHPRAAAADRHALAAAGPSGPWIDATRAQFDPAIRRGRIYASEADLAADWRQVCEDDGHDRWRDLGLRPHRPTAPGKGIVLVDHTVRLWATEEDGSPHHLQGVRVLGVPSADVRGYLVTDASADARLVPEFSIRRTTIDQLIEHGLTVQQEEDD